MKFPGRRERRQGSLPPQLWSLARSLRHKQRKQTGPTSSCRTVSVGPPIYTLVAHQQP